MNSREEAGAQVLIQVLILAHIVHSLPLLVTHVFLDRLSSHAFLTKRLTTKLQNKTVSNIIMVGSYF